MKAPAKRWLREQKRASAAAKDDAVAVAKTADSYVLTTNSDSGTTFVYDRSAAALVTKTCGPGCTW